MVANVFLHVLDNHVHFFVVDFEDVAGRLLIEEEVVFLVEVAHRTQQLDVVLMATYDIVSVGIHELFSFASHFVHHVSHLYDVWKSLTLEKSLFVFQDKLENVFHVQVLKELEEELHVA